MLKLDRFSSQMNNQLENHAQDCFSCGLKCARKKKGGFKGRILVHVGKSDAARDERVCKKCSKYSKYVVDNAWLDKKRTQSGAESAPGSARRESL